VDISAAPALQPMRAMQMHCHSVCAGCSDYYQTLKGNFGTDRILLINHFAVRKLQANKYSV